MARRNSRPPAKYTKSGKLSQAWQRWRERRAEQTRQEIATENKRKEKREYAKRAKRLAKFVPELKQYTTEKAITEKAKKRIKYREKQLAHAYNLRPVTKAQAKKLKGKLFAPGVQAIQLSETATNARIVSVGKDMMVVSNGRTWVYWSLDKVTVKSGKGMKKAGEKAFNMEFPIERLQRLAEFAFKKLKPLGVSLWTVTGRASRIDRDMEAFIRYVSAHWQAGKYVTSPNEMGRRYRSNPEEFVNGIAILIRDGHK